MLITLSLVTLSLHSHSHSHCSLRNCLSLSLNALDDITHMFFHRSLNVDARTIGTHLLLLYLTIPHVFA
jgi:hypothetical protein